MAGTPDPTEEDATKASRRHSAADMAHVQAIHDACKALGADCGESATKAGARHSAADMADFQDGHDRAVRHGAMCEGATKAISLDEQVNAARTAVWREIDRQRQAAWAINPQATAPYCDPIGVYDDYVIARCGLVFYKIPYTLSDEGAVVPPFEQWQRVEQEWAPSYAVKALDLGENQIGAYAVLFGNPAQTDLEGDFFTKDTDFYLESTGPKRPMVFEHGADRSTKSRPLVGVWESATVDDIGVWVQGQLDNHHKYAKGIKQLIDMGVLALSSDSVPNLVRRKPVGRKAIQIEAWPLFGASLTTHPMEPRMLPVAEIESAYKALGIEIQIPDGPEADAEGATAQSADARARRLRLELDLLSLETT